MRNLLVLCVLCVASCIASEAQAQWVAPNIYVMPGHGYTQSVPPNPYYNYNYQPYNYGSIASFGSNDFRVFYGTGSLSGFGGTQFNFGNGFRQTNFHYRPRYSPYNNSFYNGW